MLGAAAELERALIRERTKAGLRAVRARGREVGSPAQSWTRTAKALGRLGSPDRQWTADRLARAVRRLVAEGLADRSLIAPAPRKAPKEDILLVVAGIKGADPDISLRAIAARLEEMRIPAPRGGETWAASSVKALLGRAERLGLLRSESAG